MRARVHELLATRGFGLVDIGARGGLQPRWRELAPLLDVIAFEPDVEEAGRLARSFAGVRSTTVVPSAVWSAAGRRPLHLTRSPGCSSLLAPMSERLREYPNAERWDVVRTPEVDLSTLDDAISTHRIGKTDFVKIDVQGGALPVLEGASAMLEGVVALEVEVELLPIYQGEALFGSVDEHLRGAGFELVDLRPTYWRRQRSADVVGAKGQLVFADALYFVRPDVLADRGAASALPAVAAAAVYGLYDRIVEYASDADELDELVGLARRPTVWSRLPGGRVRHLAGHLAKDLGDALLTERSVWALAEQGLGNGPRHRRFPRR